MTHKFSSDWFGAGVPYWNVIIEQYKPKKFLEVGSFEGRSACYMVDVCSQFSPIELYCVDTWQGSVEHKADEIIENLESTFDENLKTSIMTAKNPVTFHKRKGKSSDQLPKLVAEGHRDFDLIYIDGSHVATDVMLDACFSFQLLKVGGILIFDDYLWEGWNEMSPEDIKNLLETHHHPKPAIDAFLSIFTNKFHRLVFDGNVEHQPYQLYLVKHSEL